MCGMIVDDCVWDDLGSGSHHVESLIEPFQHISCLSLIGHHVSKMNLDEHMTQSKIMDTSLSQSVSKIMTV